MPQTHIANLPLRTRSGTFSRVRSAFLTALTRRRERQRLAHLDAHLLRDIGLDPQEVRREYTKPFWQP
ncbi:DUF1127 domain-containing protein [Tabrizicola sp.]|uniref:DUF1127 domain-containing protein n=1 Tax=Tabrizicola sp. TaxID=2005166 RepID=UPI0027364D4D|nr:DUF1127 domain-containing protein [Tabrizicola sp.]MDP3196294.1 DUF1127 domain-containing protein [Tabrizicola sp.]